MEKWIFLMNCLTSTVFHIFFKSHIFGKKCLELNKTRERKYSWQSSLNVTFMWHVDWHRQALRMKVPLKHQLSKEYSLHVSCHQGRQQNCHGREKEDHSFKQLEKMGDKPLNDFKWTYTGTTTSSSNNKTTTFGRATRSRLQWEQTKNTVLLCNYSLHMYNPHVFTLVSLKKK